MDSLKVQLQSSDISPEASNMQEIESLVISKQIKEEVREEFTDLELLLHMKHESENQEAKNLIVTERLMSRHKKPKKANTLVVSQDYICDDEDNEVIHYITSSPQDSELVHIDDITLKRSDLNCLLQDDKWLDDEAISAYIYCLQDQEHLLHRTGGKVYMENTFVSNILWRDGEVRISTEDRQLKLIADHVDNCYIDKDMIFLPINIIKHYWYLAVINVKQRKIQVLDSCGTIVVRNELIRMLNGLKKYLHIWAERRCDKNHKWQDLDVTTWQAVDKIQNKIQTDGSSCGHFMLNFMEY